LNVLPVHVEHLGSIENVAKAKAELVEGMKSDGTAVLNADDPRVIAMRALAKSKVVTFGIKNEADVAASNIQTAGFGKTSFDLRTPNGSAAVSFSLNGIHSISNALAAAAVGHVFGMTQDEIATSLSTVSSPPQRGEVLHFAEGFTVIDDSYNSNPAALMSMVRTLVDGSSAGQRKIVVAGEMLELGADEAAIHKQTGVEIAKSGVDLLIGVRGLAEEMAESAKVTGLIDSEFAEDSEQAGSMLSKLIRPGDVVLVKGSRGVRTENVIEALLKSHKLEDAEAD